MARGDHPQRTPLYGALMLVAVWWVGATVTLLHAPTAVKVVVLIIASAGRVGRVRDDLPGSVVVRRHNR